MVFLRCRSTPATLLEPHSAGNPVSRYPLDVIKRTGYGMTA